MAHPFALLLLVPALLAWWRWGRHGAGSTLRLIVLVLVVVAAAGPRRAGSVGTDVILVLDRSASVGEARARQDELVRLAGAERGPGDRLGVVAVAAGAMVVAPPLAEGLPDLAGVRLDDQASELASGIDLARSLVPEDRRGRVVVLSDGEDTGRDPRPVAAASAAAGVVVDALPEVRPGAADAAVLAIELPGALRLGESFVGAARLWSERAEDRAWTMLRGDTVIGQGVASLKPGAPTTVTFADRPPRPGLTAYRLLVDATGDPRPANNEANACLRVDGGERVLVMGGDGSPGNLVRALEAAGVRVATRAEGSLTLAELTGYSAVVLEQVPAVRLGHDGQVALAAWVEQAGGGLVMLGGKRSFGGGGWHRSPVEDVLPVTCEIRDEHRKLAVAMVIALDRSGSMSATVTGGKTKMALADEGACAAIDLLGPRDKVAVFAVDTAAHEIVGLTPATGKGGLKSAVSGIVSEGGGINVRTALEAAGAAVLRADTGTRHIVLFADASDADEQEGSVALTDDLVRGGVTVSVVAMGTPADGDAAFLQEIARHGGGRCHFAATAEDLPRVFAQETLLVARATWVDQAVIPVAFPALALAMPGLPALPRLPGYNLSYPRERAERWATCPGDPEAPAAAAWRIGTGRSVALPFDHEDLGAWPGRAALLAGVTRWAAGGGTATAALTALRRGRTLDLTLTAPATAEVAPVVRCLGPSGAVLLPVELVRSSPTTWTGSATLTTPEALLPVATVDGAAVLGAPQVVPYGPEAEPRGDRPTGTAVLEGVARAGQGQVRRDLAGIFTGLPPAQGGHRDLAWPLVALALCLAVLEIAVRRLGLGWPRLPRRRVVSAPDPAPESAPVPPDPADALGQAFSRARRR